MGPRKIPSFENPLHDKVLFSSNSVFNVDVDKNIVSIKEDKKEFNVGSKIVYTYGWLVVNYLTDYFT